MQAQLAAFEEATGGGARTSTRGGRRGDRGGHGGDRDGKDKERRDHGDERFTRGNERRDRENREFGQTSIEEAKNLGLGFGKGERPKFISNKKKLPPVVPEKEEDY